MYAVRWCLSYAYLKKQQFRKPTRPVTLETTFWGSGYSLDLYVQPGGAYICGEETALLESLKAEKRKSPQQTAISGSMGIIRLPDGGNQQCWDHCRRTMDRKSWGDALRCHWNRKKYRNKTDFPPVEISISLVSMKLNWDYPLKNSSTAINTAAAFLTEKNLKPW